MSGQSPRRVHRDHLHHTGGGGPHRFTVLRHRAGNGFKRPDFVMEATRMSIAAGPVHWDWMFAPVQPSGLLWTWATDPPSENPFKTKRTRRPEQDSCAPLVLELTAIRLPDHRFVYLDYEGELTNGRGTVERVVTGTYVPITGLPSVAPDETSWEMTALLSFAGEASQNGTEQLLRLRFQCAEASGPKSSLWTLRLDSVTADGGSSDTPAIE